MAAMTLPRLMRAIMAALMLLTLAQGVRGAPSCSFTIEPAFSSSDQYLNLAEVQVFDASGQQVPASALTASMSSTWSAAYSVASCFDGVANETNNLCATRLSGSLTVTYNCALQLQRVVVFNRVSNNTRLTQRITSYRMVFSGQASPVPPFYFNRGPPQAVYNVLASERCSFRIQPENATWANGLQHHINLAEIQAFNTANQQIPAGLLFPYMSAEWPNTPVARCFDGVTSEALNFCASSGARPALTVEYPCSQVVGRLTVYNRVAPLWTQSRILNYAVRFMGPNSTDVGLPDYKFSLAGTQAVYDIPVLCTVRIEAQDPAFANGTANPINLEEISLTRKLVPVGGGPATVVDIDPALLLRFSTIEGADATQPLALCFDGVTGDATNFCRSTGANPTLSVRYPCGLSPLDTVTVYNRWTGATPAEQEAITLYQATFLNAAGQPFNETEPSYTFNVAQDVYDIDTAGLGAGRGGGRYGR